MSQPISKTSDDSLILGICVAVVALLVFVLSYRVSSYIQLQNDNLTSNIQGMKRQFEQSRPMIETNMRFRDALVQYVQKTGDGAVLQRMAYYGIVQVQQQPAGQSAAGAPAAGAAAPNSAAPAAPAGAPAATPAAK